MPDGDKFERRLRGKGWRRVYRLACSDGTQRLIVDELIKASAAAIRNGVPVTLFPRTTDELWSALQLESQMKRLGSDSLREFAYLTLADNLSNGGSSGEFDLVQGLGDSARSVFLELRQSHLSATQKQVVDRLAEVFLEKVVQMRFLARVRDGIMEQYHRSVTEQIGWEQSFGTCY